MDIQYYLDDYKQAVRQFAEDTKEWNSLEDNKFYVAYGYEWEENFDNINRGLDIKWAFKKENITDTAYLQEVIVDELFIIYVNGESLSDKININENGPTVILMVGVNGVGKTTTIGKLAHKYKSEGKKVMLIAGDTFRAG